MKREELIQLLNKYKWKVIEGSEQLIGSPSDIYAEFKIDGIKYIMIIDDGNCDGILDDALYHIYCGNLYDGKIFEGRISTNTEFTVVMKTLGLASLTPAVKESLTVEPITVEEWFDNHFDCYSSEDFNQKVIPCMTKEVFLQYASKPTVAEREVSDESFDFDFAGQVMANIQIKGGKPIITAAVNGYGDPIDISSVIIKERNK